MTKHRQVGPPVRYHNYLVRVIDDGTDVLAEAVHVKPELEQEFAGEEHFYWPKNILLTEHGIVVEETSGTPCCVPNDVLRALLKIGLWKVETP